jgi:hypothetical protein
MVGAAPPSRPALLRAAAAAAGGTGGATAQQVALQLNLLDQRAAVQRALDALVCEVKGTYELRANGSGGVEVAYQFPADALVRLAARRGWRVLLEGVAPLALRALKAFVGAFLVFSISLGAFVLVLILLRAGGGGGGDRSGLNHTLNWLIYWDLWRVWRQDQRWDEARQEDEAVLRAVAHPARGEAPSSGFADDVFDFIFGPGAPKGAEESEWDLVRRRVAQGGFKVTAEELRPLVHDAEPAEEVSFMGRICAGLGGEVFSDDGKGLRYRFPELEAQEAQEAQEALAARANAGRAAYLREPLWLYSAKNSHVVPVALGVANLICLMLVWPYVRVVEILDAAAAAGASVGGAGVVAFDGGGLRGFQAGAPYAARRGPSPLVLLLLRLASALWRPLLGYAALFFAIPLSRWAAIAVLNARIDKRNAFRAGLVARALA